MAKTTRHEYDLFTRQYEMVKTEPAESKPRGVVKSRYLIYGSPLQSLHWWLNSG